MDPQQHALLVRHRTRPGLREAVRDIWLAHMAPAVQGNPDHLAYYYCFDQDDLDALSAFQLYSSAPAAEEFVQGTAYAAYECEVAPLLQGPPAVQRLAPQWSKPER